MANLLVIGGAGGVGSEVVSKLVARGDAVATTVLNGTEAAQVSQRHGNQVAVHEVDLSSADTALVRLCEIIASMDALDGVAVCAAIAADGPVEVTPLAHFRKAFEINCVADIAIYQAAMPALRRSKGRIVFISSVSGRLGMPFVGAYTASKYALEGIADVMRREAAEQGVRISVIEPGGIRTGMLKAQLATIESRLAALSEGDRALYEHLYRRFNTVAGDSLLTASTAEQVADVVLVALDAGDPEPRYAAGEDARQMLELVRTMSDREMDGLFGQMFSQKAAAPIGWAT